MKNLYKFFVLFAIVLLVLSGIHCGGDSDNEVKPEPPKKKPGISPLIYNNKLSHQITLVAKKVNALNLSLKKRNTKKIKDALTQMQDQVSQSLETVMGMDGFEGDTTYRDAVVEYLEFQKNLAYGQIVDVISTIIDDMDGTAPTSDQQWEIIDQDLKAVIADERAEEENVMRAQSDFASQHNLNITKKRTRIGW